MNVQAEMAAAEKVATAFGEITARFVDTVEEKIIHLPALLDYSGT